MVITKIASALRALGGIHGARSERGRCQEHHAITQHAAYAFPPRLVVFTSKRASRSDAEPSDVDLEWTRQ